LPKVFSETVFLKKEIRVAFQPPPRSAATTAEQGKQAGADKESGGRLGDRRDLHVVYV